MKRVAAVPFPLPLEMPELPEVETIVRQLAPALPGHTILKVGIRRSDVLEKSAVTFRRALRGREILEVGRRGKNIVISLSGPVVLVVNLGMTGRLLFFPGPKPSPLPPHLAVQLQLQPASSLFYADVRRFGLLRTFSPEEWVRESARLGPEPMDSSLTWQILSQALRVSRSPIRSWLLDQRKIAGIGNIYAAEALFLSGIHPKRPASSLSPSESKALLSSVRVVLKAAIRAKGTTLRDYRTASGEKGAFVESLRVYGRDGKACLSCKAPVERIVFGNRSAFFCPHCQPESS